jgi:hypothetical protein
MQTNTDPRVIGTVKRGNRITGLIVSVETVEMFEAAFDGLLKKPIYVTAIPPIFSLFQGEREPEVTYEED